MSDLLIPEARSGTPTDRFTPEKKPEPPRRPIRGSYRHPVPPFSDEELQAWKDKHPTCIENRCNPPKPR